MITTQRGVWRAVARWCGFRRAELSQQEFWQRVASMISEPDAGYICVVLEQMAWRRIAGRKQVRAERERLEAYHPEAQQMCGAYDAFAWWRLGDPNRLRFCRFLETAPARPRKGR